MNFHELDSVVLERDVPEHGLLRGDLGAVVALLEPGGLSVEFVRADGSTQAIVDLVAADVRPATDHDITAVRPR